MQVQDDIVAQLRMHDPLRLLSSMNRPNIQYSVRFTDLLKNQVRRFVSSQPSVALCPRAPDPALAWLRA